jgi:hypothetical protein
MSLDFFPRLIQYRRQCRNGLYPAANLWTSIVAAENHLVAYRKREIYRRAWELAVVDSFAGTTNVARFRFRTGYGVTRLAYVLIMGLDNKNIATNPRIDIDTTISGGATSTLTFYYGLQNSAGSTDGPDTLSAQRQEVTVTANTVYEVTVKTIDYARPIALMAYELASPTVDEATDYYNTQQPMAGAPIYDADRQRIVEGLSNMYRRNGGITWHWSLTDGASRTRSSATHINILDNSTTGTPTTAHYGFYLNPQYHNTESRTTVPFELGVYGSIGAGSGTVRLIDTSGNTYGTVTINGAAAWRTATLNLPTTETFFVPQFAGDGANTVSVSAISLIEYEA